MSKNYNDKELKDQGNKLFATRNYDGAIECYTKAILKNPSVPHYYTNRALCYLNQKRWPQAIQDSKMALEKEPNLVKGHFYLGKISMRCLLLNIYPSIVMPLSNVDSWTCTQFM